MMNIAVCMQPSRSYTPCPEKNGLRYFQLQLLHFLVDFYNFCTIENRYEYFTTMCNLLTYIVMTS